MVILHEKDPETKHKNKRVTENLKKINIICVCKSILGRFKHADIVPLDVAKELTFTGRILSGEEAQELGLVTKVVDDPLAHAMEIAHEIAAKSPDAIRMGKVLLETVWHSDERTGLELESSLQTALIGSPNQVEAVKANFEKRTPNFIDPE